MVKGERRQLSREEIVRTALRVARRVGLDGLSMRLLGDELGVSPMAVYYHVPNKDALVSLVADEAVAELVVPKLELMAAPSTPEDWIVGARSFAMASREHYLRYPGLAGFLLSHGPPPNALAVIEAELAGLRKLGATPTEAARIYSASAAWLLTQIHGETVRATNEGERSARLSGLISAPVDRYPTLVEVAPSFIEVLDPRSRYEYGLERLLEGLLAELHRIVARVDGG